MIKNKRLVIAARADQQEFRKLLRRLKSSGWSGPILQSEAEFAKACGVADVSTIRLTDSPGEISRTRRGGRQIGEIFLSDGAVLYIRLQAESFEPTIEIGAIYRQENVSAEKTLQELGQVVQKLIPECVDGRKVRHANLEWTSIEPESRRLKKLLEGEELNVHFESPNISAEEAAAAEAMIPAVVREIMQDSSRYGFRPKKELISKYQKKFPELESTIQKLTSLNLFTPEYLVECKRSGTPLTRLKDKADLGSTVGALICPWCNNKFADENVTEGYLLSDLGKKLVKKSHWMDVVITQRLVALGIPIGSILWNLTEATEEVDIVIVITGDLWIFELKDREFGAGDAHPFNYRRLRYEADKGVLITTSKVSVDARKTLSELLQQSDSSEDSVLYVEGLEKVVDVLNKELSQVTLQSASARLRGLAQYCGFNLAAVVNEVLRKAQAKAASRT